MSGVISKAYQERVASGEIRADVEQMAVLPELDRIAAGLSAAPARKRGLFGIFAKEAGPVRGLYLWGGVGRGKSMVMDLFVSCVDVPARRVHFHAFMQEIHAAMHAARQRGVDDALKPVAEAIAADLRLLAFDEMQITDITDAMIVGRLFEQLFDAGVTVVTTSNRVPDDLYKSGLNRQIFVPFIELLKERMVVHHLHSPTDYRQDRLAGAQVYFTPADGAARTALDGIFTDLTDGPAGELTLVVKGREVVIPAYQNGVGRMAFWALCGVALGPADYLAVAEALRVLIIDDVPLLSRSNFNEAKRFVTLIDALYEAKVRLVMSAADIPERLYVEGEGTFEFERTASRLREMQAEDWGADRA